MCFYTPSIKYRRRCEFVLLSHLINAIYDIRKNRVTQRVNIVELVYKNQRAVDLLCSVETRELNYINMENMSFQRNFSRESLELLKVKNTD